MCACVPVEQVVNVHNNIMKVYNKRSRATLGEIGTSML